MLVLAVGVLAAAVFFALVDDTRGAFAAAMVGAGVLLLSTWARSVAFPGRHWAALGLVLGGVAVLGPVLVAVGVFLALVVLSLVLGMSLSRRVRGVQFEPVGPEVVMKGAEAALAAFETDGFRRLGGHRMQLGGPLVTSTVLVGSDRDRFANVTDRVSEVASRFGGRWLVTINSGLSPLPPDILRQEVSSGAPSDLIGAHASALELLAGRGLRPDRFETDAEVLAAAQENDLRAVASFAPAGLTSFLRIESRRRAREPVLGDDEQSRSRIEAWLAAPAS
jgi:hypothetical protein